MAAFGSKHWSRKSSQRKSLLIKLIIRDDGRCRYCGVKVERGNGGPSFNNMATVEHYPVPRRDLPVERWFDIDCAILACWLCNQLQDRAGGLVPIERASK